MKGSVKIPRRRVLRILAATLAVPLAAVGMQTMGTRLQPVTWRGAALGAQAQITVWHARPAHARATLIRIEAELARLGRIFDLHDARSEIARLNSTGRLTAPSADMRHVLGAALVVAEASGGAFDPTIQPLWRARFEGALPERVASAQARVGWADVDLGARAIRLARPGAQITLNGIAQGYVADRIAMMLDQAGFAEALIDAGEVRALGSGPGDQGHLISLIDPVDPRQIAAGPGLRLSDTALAVSGGYGLRLADGGHHIVDPASGRSAGTLTEAVVSHQSAMMADAWSTALYVAGPERAAQMITAGGPEMGARLRLADGRVVRFGYGQAVQAQG